MARQPNRSRTRKSRTSRGRPREPQVPPWLLVDEPPTWSEVVSSVRLFEGVWWEVWTENEQRWLDRRLNLALRLGLREFEAWGRDLQSPDLNHLSTTKLLAAFQHSYWGEVVISNLVPVSHDPDRLVRLAAGYETLIADGLLTRAMGEPVDPLGSAKVVGSAQLPSKAVWDEVLRRGEDHRAGFAAAIIRLGRELSRLGTSADHWVVPAARSYGGGEDRISQAFFTVDKEWGGLDPFQALRRALLGKLDIAKTAVERDRLDDRRKQRRHRRVTIQFNEQDRDAASQAVRNQVERQRAESYRQREQQNRHDAELRSAIAAMCDRHPALKLSAYFDALEDGKNQKQAASEAGISARTARNYDALFREAFGPLDLSSLTRNPSAKPKRVS